MKFIYSSISPLVYFVFALISKCLPQYMFLSSKHPEFVSFTVA